MTSVAPSDVACYCKLLACLLPFLSSPTFVHLATLLGIVACRLVADLENLGAAKCGLTIGLWQVGGNVVIHQNAGEDTTEEYRIAYLGLQLLRARSRSPLTFTSRWTLLPFSTSFLILINQLALGWWLTCWMFIHWKPLCMITTYLPSQSSIASCTPQRICPTEMKIAQPCRKRLRTHVPPRVRAYLP